MCASSQHTVLRNLNAKAEYIALVDQMRPAASMLAEQPGLGWPGRVPDTRELAVKKIRYVVPNRVQGDVVEILRAIRRRVATWLPLQMGLDL